MQHKTSRKNAKMNDFEIIFKFKNVMSYSDTNISWLKGIKILLTLF